MNPAHTNLPYDLNDHYSVAALNILIFSIKYQAFFIVFGNHMKIILGRDIDRVHHCLIDNLTNSAAELSRIAWYQVNMYQWYEESGDDCGLLLSKISPLILSTTHLSHRAQRECTTSACPQSHRSVSSIHLLIFPHSLPDKTHLASHL
jgi:hypothetical protein